MLDLVIIATNIHAGHFLGIAGSAYIYGLAQANLEINAVFGLLLKSQDPANSPT